MDRPIGKGDLVVVVRGCGCWSGRIKIARSGPETDSRRWVCPICQFIVPATEHFIQVDGEINSIGYYALSWLQCIDPDILRDDVPTNEELHV